MNVLRPIRFLLGSFTVYAALAMAHGCGPSGPLPFGSGGASASTASSAHGGGGALSAGSMMNPVPDAFADSGSRLRVQWMTGDDGSKQFSGFYDSKRKETCGWRKLYDGNTYCTPAAGVAYSNFSDAGCTQQPVMVVAPCTPAPLYTVTYNACAADVHVYQRGAKLALATIYTGTPSQCIALPPTVGYDYFALGAEIPPSAFVSATIVTE